MEILFVFPTTYFLTRAHTVLKKDSIQHEMILKPSSLFSDCGMAIGLSEKLLENTKETLSRNNISQYGVFVNVSNQWIPYEE